MAKKKLKYEESKFEDARIEGVFDDIASGVLSYFPEDKSLEFLDETRFFGKLRFNQGVSECLDLTNKQN